MLSICLSVLLPVGYSHVGGGILPVKSVRPSLPIDSAALSRVPSDNLPFACQFPLGNDEFLRLLLRRSL